MLPTCSPGWTGPGCDWPCDGAECGFASYCHGDGRTWGLAAFGARLFEASPKLEDEVLHALFEQFVVEHPEDVGLAAGEICAATPPYVCTPMNLPPGLSASDAFMPAFLYALRVDANSFRQFIDAFATQVSCNLGAAVCDAAEGADVTGATDVGNDVTGAGVTEGDATGGGGVIDDGGGCECSAASNRGADLAPACLGLLALIGCWDLHDGGKRLGEWRHGDDGRAATTVGTRRLQ
ncbi:hypothetical protein [Paraliomyxa miuraensis]|uniref:hypothetical protein n=1 Tax=Paraliomyxa miuraensis TaxID=376150 RepID=UPI002258056C|nr:hypothetical protein [Paraliomyxa miuraensis]MCX4246624.1 hypothetical protein [Paraliomyxa miuraensis]